MTRKISVRLSFNLGYIRYIFRLALVSYSVRMSAAYKIVMIRHGESEWNKVSFLDLLNFENLKVPQFFRAALVSVRIRLYGYGSSLSYHIEI
jgi:hypothetical protein